MIERRLEVSGEPLTLVERDARFARRVKQRRLYETLEQLGGSISVKHLKDTLGMSDAVIRALADSGLARVVKAERMRDPFEGEPGTPPPAELTAEQADVLVRIEGLEPGSGALLFGVTGSGKTLVYLRAVERAVASGRGAIVLVPEIGLTPQMVSRVRGMFGNNVAVLHSGLSDRERADAWRLLRRGERRVAVGARSAVFAPVQDLGLIVVDEEHEQSYKNGEAPRYHAREVVRVRAKLEGARFVFGSATPSLETWALFGGGSPAVHPSTRPAVQAPPERSDGPSSYVSPTASITVPCLPWKSSICDTRRPSAPVHRCRGPRGWTARSTRYWPAASRHSCCSIAGDSPPSSSVPSAERYRSVPTVLLPDSPPGAAGAPLSLLRQAFPGPCGLCQVRPRGAAGSRDRHPAARGAGRGAVPRGPARPDGPHTTSARWSHHRILERIEKGQVDRDPVSLL